MQKNTNTEPQPGRKTLSVAWSNEIHCRRASPPHCTRTRQAQGNGDTCNGNANSRFDIQSHRLGSLPLLFIIFGQILASSEIGPSWRSLAKLLRWRELLVEQRVVEPLTSALGIRQPAIR